MATKLNTEIEKALKIRSKKKRELKKQLLMLRKHAMSLQ